MTSKAQYLRFLKSTLIPDLKDSGRKYTASDLSKCVRLIAKNKKDHKFAHWLKTTLIPDLKASGDNNVAADFKTCVKYISPAKAYKPKARKRG